MKEQLPVVAGIRARPLKSTSRGYGTTSPSLVGLRHLDARDRAVASAERRTRVVQACDRSVSSSSTPSFDAGDEVADLRMIERSKR